MLRDGRAKDGSIEVVARKRNPVFHGNIPHMQLWYVICFCGCMLLRYRRFRRRFLSDADSRETAKSPDYIFVVQ